MNEQLLARLRSQKGEVIAFATFPNPSDAHLILVCINLRQEEYVIWTCNTEVAMSYPDCGCAHGTYTDNCRTALQKFTERLADMTMYR